MSPAVAKGPLLVAVVAYATASLIHFSHNAEFLAEYPNLPAWLSRGQVYAAWLGVTAVGVVGYLLVRSRRELAGLVVLAVYGLLGLGGLAHYAVASPSAHTLAMSATIWLEVATAMVLLVVVAGSMLTLMRDRHRDDLGQQETFGCDRCWPAAAQTAWEARGELAGDTELIVESHFHVAILACPSCSQRFVSVVTETIDWDAGEDPQYWTLLPVTPPEARQLIERRAPLTEETFDSIGTGRRSFRRDHPKAGPPRVHWGLGIQVGPHD